MPNGLCPQFLAGLECIPTFYRWDQPTNDLRCLGRGGGYQSEEVVIDIVEKLKTWVCMGSGNPTGLFIHSNIVQPCSHLAFTLAHQIGFGCLRSEPHQLAAPVSLLTASAWGKHLRKNTTRDVDAWRRRYQHFAIMLLQNHLFIRCYVKRPIKGGPGFRLNMAILPVDALL